MQRNAPLTYIWQRIGNGLDNGWVGNGLATDGITDGLATDGRGNPPVVAPDLATDGMTVNSDRRY